MAERFGAVHRRDVSSMGEAIRCLCRTYPRRGDEPGFFDMLTAEGASYTLLAGTTALRPQDINMATFGLEYDVVPFVEGNKDKMAQTIIGVIIAVVAFYFMGPAGSGAVFEAGTASGMVGSAIASFGISMAVGGIAQMLASSPVSPKISERPENKPSAIYDGAVNTIGQNNPVQILYGKMEVGSAVLSTMIANDDKDYGTLGEWGFDEAAQVNLFGGGTAPFDTATNVLAYDNDGVAGAATVYSVNKGFGATQLVTTSAGSLKVAEFETVLREDKSAARPSELKPGDVLFGGSTVVSVGTREARSNLKSLTLDTNQTPHEPGPGETWRAYWDGPEWEVYFINGLPVPASTYQRPLNDYDGQR